MLVFFRTRLQKSSVGQNFLQGKSPTLICIFSPYFLFYSSLVKCRHFLRYFFSGNSLSTWFFLYRKQEETIIRISPELVSEYIHAISLHFFSLISFFAGFFVFWRNYSWFLCTLMPVFVSYI